MRRMDAADLPTIPDPFKWKRPELGARAEAVAARRWTISVRVGRQVYEIASTSDRVPGDWGAHVGRHRDRRLQRYVRFPTEEKAIEHVAKWVNRWASEILAEIGYLANMPKSEIEAYVDRELKRQHRQ